MWRWSAACATAGVTIILTTHYIEEAEEMADRIGVISKGEIILVEDKAALMRKLGKKQLTVELQTPLEAVARRASTDYDLSLAKAGHDLIYTFDPTARTPASRRCSAGCGELGVEFKDLHTDQSSLEDIFVDLVRAGR